MNDRQWEILSFRLSAIEEAVESMDRKLCELAHISQILDGPPKDATCGTCRWFDEGTDLDPDFDGSCLRTGRVYTGDTTDGEVTWGLPHMHKSNPACRHWRPRS